MTIQHSSYKRAIHFLRTTSPIKKGLSKLNYNSLRRKNNLFEHNPSTFFFIFGPPGNWDRVPLSSYMFVIVTDSISCFLRRHRFSYRGDKWEENKVGGVRVGYFSLTVCQLHIKIFRALHKSTSCLCDLMLFQGWESILDKSNIILMRI